MSYIPTPEQALELVKQYNKEAFHIQHAETVGKVMGYIAAQYDPGKEDYWTAVGMEKYLFAVDEITGLIGAAALKRPTGYEGMEVKSVMKKFKDKKFAAGCSRDVITKGAEMLGISVQELADLTLKAMTA